MINLTFNKNEVNRILSGMMEIGSPFPTDMCRDWLALYDEVQRLEKELERVAPFLAIHGIDGYEINFKEDK